MTNIVKASFNETEITFTSDGWINATAIAAKYGKDVYEWTRLPATTDYINAMKRKYGEIPYLKTKRGANGGTWIHPKLGVRFAQWIDIDFAVWCDEQIDSLINGKTDWKKLRHESSASYKVMQEFLMLSRQAKEKPTMPHHYSNEARLINWALTGEFKSVDRDTLELHELDLLAKLETRNSMMLGHGLEYDLRKVALEKFATDWKKPVLIAA